MLKYSIALLISASATYACAGDASGFGTSENECKIFAESVSRTSAGVDQTCFSRICDSCRKPIDED
jgi:hypothetical protein